jgi:DNA mismatch endonuclease (patch repair protein)
MECVSSEGRVRELPRCEDNGTSFRLCGKSGDGKTLKDLPVRSNGTNPDCAGGRRSPSFKGFTAASEASATSKRKNRSTCTLHEAQLRSLLWRRGLRFRKNVRSLEGKPDIVFIRQRVAVFCDGDFWHGRKWKQLLQKLSAGHNSQYWVKKIQTNRERDKRTNAILRRSGWLVLRFWETDIQRTPGAVYEDR